jgi:hypothetical protein
MEAAASFLLKGVGGVWMLILDFMIWFYLEFIPFVLQYLGIPLFILGVIMAIAFAGGTLLFAIVFCIFMYYFIKGTIFDSSP